MYTRATIAAALALLLASCIAALPQFQLPRLNFKLGTSLGAIEDLFAALTARNTHANQQQQWRGAQVATYGSTDPFPLLRSDGQTKDAGRASKCDFENVETKDINPGTYPIWKVFAPSKFNVMILTMKIRTSCVAALLVGVADEFELVPLGLNKPSPPPAGFSSVVSGKNKSKSSGYIVHVIYQRDRSDVHPYRQATLYIDLPEYSPSEEKCSYKVTHMKRHFGIPSKSAKPFDETSCASGTPYLYQF